MEAALRKSDGMPIVKEEMRVESNGCKEQIVLKLESAKAEMGEVIEENQRLKMCLNRLMKDYQTLQMQFSDIAGKEEANDEEPELVSLRLGRTSSTSDEIIKIEKPRKSKEGIDDDKKELALGLDCNKFTSQVSKSDGTSLVMKPGPENSSDEGGESCWPPNKVLKRSGDEVSEQNPVKRTRVSVRARCDTPTMNDGCQWRKYGQKIAKGNPCPRAYYRCSLAPSCPVRKQVQRCAGDVSILITTYEGTHNHPLPISATAMASATSAAASMLMSGSSTSSSAAAPITTSPANHLHLHGLNFYLSDNNSKSNHNFHLSSNSSISSSLSHPTITLDLTSSTTSTYSSPAHQFNNMSSNFLWNSKYNSSTNLNFSTIESSPISWNNGVLNYQTGSLNFGRQPQENFYKSLMQKNNPNPNYQQPQPVDGIAAATKAITSDPSFQSALAIALKSIIDTSGGAGGGGSGGQTFPVGISNLLGANKCSSSYLNRSTTAANPQPGNMLFLQPSLPFSNSQPKTTASPGNRDNGV